MKSETQTAFVFASIFIVFILFGYTLGNICENSCRFDKVSTTFVFGILGLLLGTVAAHAASKNRQIASKRITKKKSRR